MTTLEKLKSAVREDPDFTAELAAAVQAEYERPTGFTGAFTVVDWTHSRQALADFTAAQERQADLKWDENRAFSLLVFQEGALSALGSRTGMTSRLTPWALTQLGSMVGVPPYFVTRLYESGSERLIDLADHILNEKCAYESEIKDREVLLRLRAEGNEQYCRAFLSGRYGIIDNLDMMQLITAAFPVEGREEAVCPYVFDDGDRIQGAVILPESIQLLHGIDLASGIYFANAENGQRQYSIRPFLCRIPEGNACVWGGRMASDRLGRCVAKRHYGKIDFEDLSERTDAAIATAMSQGAELLRLLGFLREIKIHTVEAVITSLTRRAQLPLLVSRLWYSVFSARPGETAFDLWDALTLAASGMKGETREKLEVFAGTLLGDDLFASQEDLEEYWDEILRQATRLFRQDQKLVYKSVLEGV